MPVVFQNVKHLIEIGCVADDAQLHTQPLQPFQHFLHVGAESTVIVGDLPHVGPALGVRTHRIFIQAETVKTKLPQISSGFSSRAGGPSKRRNVPSRH